MEALEAIKTRRSVRSFKQVAIPEKIFAVIEEVIMHCPSGGNSQESHFVIIREQEQIRKIKRFAQGVSGMPAAIIVLCTNKKEALLRGGKDTLEVLRFVNLGIAASYIMLATHANGIANCPVRSFHQAAIKKIIGLPEEIEPELLISLGYADHTPRPKNVKSLTEVISYEQYGKRRA